MEWLESLPTACHAVCDIEKTGHGVCVLLDGAWIKAAAKRLYKHEYFIEDITCLDVEEGMLLLYHFDHFDNPGRVTVRVVVDREEAKVPSIADIYQGAEWHERECMDFYPVVFTGNPNPSRLLLPDDMQEKPLVRKEKNRAPMLDIFQFQDLASCSEDNPLAPALRERLEAMQAEAQAAEEADAKAAEEAAAEAAGDAPAEDA